MMVIREAVFLQKWFWSAILTWWVEEQRIKNTRRVDRRIPAG